MFICECERFYADTCSTCWTRLHVTWSCRLALFAYVRGSVLLCHSGQCASEAGYQRSPVYVALDVASVIRASVCLCVTVASVPLRLAISVALCKSYMP